MQTLSVSAALAARAERSPDAPFFHCGTPADPWVTPSGLHMRAARLAGGLASLGITRGDRVALLMPNRLEMVEALFACATLGAIQVPMNYWIRGDYLRYQLNDCGARMLIADRAGFETAEPLLDSTGIERVVLLDGEAPSGGARYADLLTSSPAGPVAMAPGDLMSISYTSGTTAEPKGCMLSHGYYTQIGRTYLERNWVIPGDREYTAFPLFHVSGQLLGVMSTLTNDASLAVADEFHASTFVADAASLGATMLFGVGAMANALLNQPVRPEDGTYPFRVAIFAPLAPGRQLEFEERFRTPVMAEGFGQTECVQATQSDVNGARSRGTSGPAAPLYEVQIVDDDDQPVPAGVPGEIVVRPKHAHTMYSGYWNKPEVTVATWRNLWHHTGDFGRMDDNGCLSFVDRMKDRLRRRGENVSSLHLEETLRGMTGVAEVAVCGLPGQLGDDDIKACIVETEPGALSAQAVFEFLRDRVAYFAIPRYVHVHQALPVNAMRRVMKDRLRAEGVPEDCWDLEELGLIVPKDERRGPAMAG